MHLAAPGRLWLLLAVAGIAVAYGAAQFARRRAAARFASPALLPVVAPHRPPWWRHLFAVVGLVALAVATIGWARPTTRERVPRETATIMLAIDTSDSMAATDVTPTRIAAATKAARSFVEDLPAGFSVGLVTAGAGAGVVVAPTTDHGAVLSALGQLQLHPGTALGDAILAALAAADPGSTRQDATPGTVPAARIVLLSDGISTTGAPDDTAISAAHDARIPVSTIAFGTSSATVQSQGQTVSVPVDATALRRIAEGTDGQFFGGVTSTAELRTIYERIGTDIRYVDQDRDLASWFAGLAFLLLFAAVAASMATTARAVPA